MKILAIIYASIVLHEFGHAFLFKIQGIQIVKIMIFPLEFTRNSNNKWKVKIRFNFFCFGLVVPQIPILNHDVEKEFNSIYKKALLAGPCMNAVIIFFSMMFLVIDNYKLLYYVLFLNLFILLNCFSDSTLIMGDIVAYKRISECREIFLLVLFTSYLEDQNGKKENIIYFQNEFSSVLNKEINSKIRKKILIAYSKLE